MEYSNRLQKMLNRATRQPAHRRRIDIMDLFRKQSLPAFEPVLEFQERFGGLELYPGNDKDWMRYNLIRRDGTIDGFGEDWELPTMSDEKAFFIFADHRTAQVDFLMDEQGVLYALSSAEDPLPIASSIQTHLEQQAIIQEIVLERHEWFWVGFGIVPSADYRFEARMQSLAIPLALEVSDEYNGFWLNETMCIMRRAVWGGSLPEHSLSAYTSTYAEAEWLVTAVAGTTNAQSWPPTIYVPAQ